MKKSLLVLTTLIISGLSSYAQDIYSSKNGQVSFYSSTPLEDIEAKSANGVGILTISKNEILFNVQIKSFVFDKALMQEHFNENYLESDKYPTATFRGKINETIDYTKDGEYKVSATGKLNMHGVNQDRTINGTMKIKNGTISLSSQFNVACKDHGIKIPTVVSQKIAESVQVTLNADFLPFTKGK